MHLKKVCIFIEIPLFKDPMCNKSALVQVMAWCQAGTKPLPEAMMTQIYNAMYVIRPHSSNFLSTDLIFNIDFAISFKLMKF